MTDSSIIKKGFSYDNGTETSLSEIDNGNIDEFLNNPCKLPSEVVGRLIEVCDAAQLFVLYCRSDLSIHQLSAISVKMKELRECVEVAQDVVEPIVDARVRLGAVESQSQVQFITPEAEILLKYGAIVQVIGEDAFWVVYRSDKRNLVDVIRRSPGSALDWSKLGFYLSPRYIRAAEEAYLHAIDLDSTQVLAILGLGDIYEKTYRIDLAKDLYKAVIDEGVDDARINERYARYDEVFRIALELNKSEDSTDPFLSRVYDKTLSPVWETFNSLLRKVQGRVYASFILVLAGSGVLLVREYMFYERFANGYEAIEERDFELAEEEYRRALRIRPNDQFTLNSLGHALFSQHRFVEAMHFFSRALEVDPEYGLAEDNLFITFSRLEGKLYTLNEDELNELESIVRQLLDSGHLAEDRRPWLLEFLAEYLEYQDRYEEAIEVLNQLSGFEDRISRLQEMVDENSDNSE